MKDVGRIMMRVEGNYWKAYWAMSAGTAKKKKILLGAIHMSHVVNDPARKSAFLRLMQDIVSDIIEREFGVRPTWTEPTDGKEPAVWPEDELSQ